MDSPHPPLFQPPAGAPLVRVAVEGRALDVPAGLSVAAALLAAGVPAFRSTPASGAPRAPYCLMGSCFECLLEIDGVPNRQSCQVPVQAGMRLAVQQGARTLRGEPDAD